MQNDVTLRTIVDLPLRGISSRAQLATFDGPWDGLAHFAVLIGERSEVPLVRLHSECVTGDVFGSERCDCGPQLREALTVMDEKGGILLYLRQEGRGIGLNLKIDAYALQQQGIDTFTANRRLGLGDDLRSYDCAAHMLQALNVSEIELMSNNPDKGAQLQVKGITVKAMRATRVHLSEHNQRYLQAKRDMAGHQIDLTSVIAP